MNRIFLTLLTFNLSLLGRSQCDNFEMTINVSQPTCYNFSDGNVDVTVTGGTAPISVTITNENGIIVGGGKKTFSFMGGGWYYVYALDANGCGLYDSVYLVNPPQMVVEMTITDPSYPGTCDGIAVIDTVLSYQGNYSNIGYFWSPGGPYGIGQTTKTDLCDANYNVVINDEFGCNIVHYISVGSVAITEADKIEAISLFPNPMAQFLTIRSVNQINEIIVTDLSGQIVLSIQTDGKKEEIINVEELPAGVYCIKVIDDIEIFNSTLIKI